jgi:glycosyltransferase involved in cell wall biosynthesis
MKVLAVVPSAFCFGLQSMELALFAHLRRRMQCHFLNTRWTDGEFARRLDALGIAHSSTWLGMFSRRLDWRNVKMTAECLLRLPLAWRDFIRLYRSFRPDVIYLANHHEVILLLPILLWLRCKVVCHMHDPPPAILFQKMSARFWRRGVGRFLFISHDARARMVAVTELGAADAVIHNGVDISPVALPHSRDDRFIRRFEWFEHSVVFGIAGQIAAHKGHEDLVEAVAIACKRNPNIRVVIGGRGDKGYVKKLRRLIAARKLDDFICFTGWLPQVGEFYSAIDGLVLASRHDEGFGLVVAEAGERGLPCIVTRSGGVVEVVEEGVTALVVNKQAPHELAAALLQLATDAELRASMGRRARERVVAAFDLARQAALTGDSLEEFVQRP